MSDLGVIILAGGRSSRLKINKVFLKIRGEPLIRHMVRVASEVSRNIVLAIGMRDREEDFRSILPRRAKIAKDSREDKAALFGILTGLESMKAEYAAVLAADLPFVNTEVIRLLHREAKGFDLAIPRWPNGNLEPLYAIYRVPTTLVAFRDAAQSGSMRIRDVIDRLRSVNRVPVERLRSADPALRCFININTAADLERVETILRCEEASADSSVGES